MEIPAAGAVDFAVVLAGHIARVVTGISQLCFVAGPRLHEDIGVFDLHFGDPDN